MVYAGRSGIQEIKEIKETKGGEEFGSGFRLGDCCRGQASGGKGQAKASREACIEAEQDSRAGIDKAKGQAEVL